MHYVPMHTVQANRTTRRWAEKRLLLGQAARHFFTMMVVLATFSLMSVSFAREERQWLSPHFQDHPLVGSIWTSDFKSVTAEQLEISILESDFVLLGESHNNADHHRLQAQILETLAHAGRLPGVIFEMIPTSMQAELDRYLQSGSKDVGKLGKILRWEERGWPDWSIYQPIAEAAISAKLPFFGGALDRKTTRAISKSDPSQAGLILELKLHQPIKPEIVDALTREIDEGHCNLLPEAAVKPMIMVQLAKDAYMAKMVAAATSKEGAVLIAGSGHVRKDWAVPRFLKQRLPGKIITSIAFIEVDPARSSPSDYVETIAGLDTPYDFIYFTPKADLIDRCAEMAEHMKKVKPK